MVLEAEDPPIPVRRAIAVPHFAAHFALTRYGAAVVEQDTADDVAACVYRIAVCPEGYREDLPEFGIPDIAFTTIPLDLATIEEVVVRWEPRAELTVTVQEEALNEALQTVLIEAS